MVWDLHLAVKFTILGHNEFVLAAETFGVVHGEKGAVYNWKTLLDESR